MESWIWKSSEDLRSPWRTSFAIFLTSFPSDQKARSDDLDWSNKNAVNEPVNGTVKSASKCSGALVSVE